MITATLWFAALSVGIMAGVYFTFSAFVMQSLDAAGRPAGMAAMQSINRIILKSLFLPLFFASSLACLLLAVFGVMQWGNAGAWQMVTGGFVYLAGMLAVTAAANVPLNNALEATDAAGPDAEAMWRRYMQRWLPWNHVRTVSCTVSLALLIGAIAAR
ncbi:anthrone oxygenase family protein [Sphingorhabdus sp. M41]|uniref:anthrone oxygenase family protein n=1 Tax=Sphingorhabdus sp. M41 TaxID=1806885 RepID=UPI001E2E1D3E|nr:anthrone oxygenase family protein [Sphingorhabdus sp. M41]